MGCLFGLLAIVSPRLAFGLLWVFTDRVPLAFEHLWTALFGLVVLPWTALTYTLVYAPYQGVSSQGWAFVLLAFCGDVYTYVRSSQRSDYVPVSTPTYARSRR